MNDDKSPVAGERAEAATSARSNLSARLWQVRSRKINEVVRAVDQWEAWDTLRDRDALDFGLIAVAEPDESGDPIPVQTAALMRRWGREADALLFDEVARKAGLIE